MAETPVTQAQIIRQAERLAPRRNEVVAPERAAEAMFNRIVSYIREFETNLDKEHEIGARMVSFGDTVQFHIVDMGYWNPDIVTFDGLDEAGRRMKLIQNVSQLNVLLIAMPKRIEHEEPRRIGFILEKNAEARALSVPS
jgi:hypothetical protein